MIRDHLSASPTSVTSLAAVADGQFVPVPGGVLIEDVDEFAIGAIGISGDTSEKDEYCAIRAVQDAGLQAEPPQIETLSGNRRAYLIMKINKVMV